MNGDRFATIHCSIARTAGVMGDPWTLLILRDLFLGLTKYEQLRGDLGIATNVLADRLDHLVAAGLVERFAYQDRPVRHRYALTDAGRDAYSVLLTMVAWGDRHQAPAGPPLRLVHQDCGEPTAAVVVCRHCGGELRPDSVRAQAGPGGAKAPGTMVIAERLAATGLHDLS